MRLIDADLLKEDLSRFYDGLISARELIDSQPTVEPLKEQQADIKRLKNLLEHREAEVAILSMISIVRCKDCKYFQEGIDITGKPFTRCNCEKRTPTMTWGASVTPDWFCGHAEEKDGEQ